MYLSDSERTVVLIDGRHLSTISRELGFVVDFRNLLALFRRQTQLVRAVYYSVVGEEEGESPVRSLLDWLDYKGYTVATKPVRMAIDAEGRQHLKGTCVSRWPLTPWRSRLASIT